MAILSVIRDAARPIRPLHYNSGMRRLALLLVLAAVPVYAFHLTPQPGARIGVLRADGESQIVQRDLCSELRALGFDAFDARIPFADLTRGERPAADFYVDVVSTRAANHPVAGGEVGDGRVGVDLAVVVSNVAAAVRVYDAATLELVDQYDLQQDRTAVLPTAIGFGRFFWARIPLPFVQSAQIRSVAHAVAHEAAHRIAGQ